MSDLGIGEVARQAGIRPSALRYYEDVGLLPHPRRVGGRRRYDPSVVQRLAVIRFAQGAGFTVAELRTFLHGFREDAPPAERWAALARRKSQELDEVIARARRIQKILAAGLRCECVSLDDCVRVAGRGAPTP